MHPRLPDVLQSVHDEARAAGLIYDPECFDIELAGEEEFGCSTGSPRRWCGVGHYHGQVPVDGACTRHIAGYFSDCAKGHTCNSVAITGYCWDAGNQNLPAPETIYAELGEACGSPVQCRFDAFCHPDTLICEPRLLAGEPCPPGFLCGAATYCDPASRTCVPKLGAGEACTALECAAGTHCASWEDNPICMPDLAIGEPCVYELSCSTRWCGAVCAERPPTVCLQAVAAQP